MLSFGILGCGRIGQVHANSLERIKGAHIHSVSDFFDEAAQSLAARTGAKVQSTDEILQDPEIDAVLVCTPTDTHFDIIQKAAAAGKAIFCEKPVDMSVDNIRKCIQSVEDNGVKFLTAFNRRFDPNFAHLQTQIKTGAIGDVEMVTILSRDPTPPPISYVKSSGGIFRDMMVHDLDMARFLLGEEPVEIFAVGSCLVDPEIGKAGDIDTAMVTLKTASGKLCQISNSRRATYGYDQRIEVHGSKGMLKAGNILENSVQVSNENGTQSAATLNFFLERYEQAYLREMEHFVACLNGGTTPSPSITDGLRAQALADAAALSLETGKPVAL